MPKIVHIDFKKVDKKLAAYLIRRKQTRAIDPLTVTAILLAFEGIQLPDKNLIEEKELKDTYSSVYKTVLSMHKKCQLWLTISNLDSCIRFYGITKDKKESIRREHARILNIFMPEH
jgi:hypothetical protein